MSQQESSLDTAIIKPSEAERLVIFYGGFDPRGARHYHQLMQQEAAKQTKVADADYFVGARERWKSGVEAGLKHSAWSVKNGTESASEYVFFDWSDQVRGNWPKKTWQVMLQALKTYADVWQARACLPEVNKQAPYTLWTLAYPLVYMALCLLLALLVGLGFYLAIPGWLGVIAGLCAGVGLLALGYKLDQVLHVSWLLRILNFAPQAAEQPMAELRQRMEQTAEVLAQQMHQGRWREVVVVGFSVGSAMAVPFVDLLRSKLELRAEDPLKIHFLTLGNCIPLFALMPKAVELRQQLLALAEDRRVYWTDISSPSDSVSFGMCDVLGLSLREIPPQQRKSWVNPRNMCSPRFHKLFQPSSYRWLRRNKMRMHFQYLMAAELPGAYDYFAMLTCKGLLRDYIEKRLVR